MIFVECDSLWWDWARRCPQQILRKECVLGTSLSKSCKLSSFAKEGRKYRNKIIYGVALNFDYDEGS